jgi:oligosaccharide repeat unit polymerase
MMSVKSLVCACALMCLLAGGILSIVAGIDPVFILALEMWSFAFVYALANLKRRVMLTAFLLSFFVFLLGGHLVYETLGMEIKYYLGDEYYRHSNFSMFLSLAFLLTAYYLSELRMNRRDAASAPPADPWAYVNAPSTQVARAVSRWLFYGAFLFWLYLILDKAAFVSTESYVAYYAEYESSAPYAIRAIGATAPYFLYLFLATMPSKRECGVPLLLYLLYAGVSLLTGRRSNLVFMLLFVAVYFVIRDHIKVRQEKWITKRLLLTVAIAIPVGVVFLYSYNLVRMNQEVSAESLPEMFLGFFQQQGFSASLMRLEKYYAGALNGDVLYSFFGLTKWVRTNSLFQAFVDFEYNFSYLHNSAEFATLGNSLSNALGYIVLPRAQYLGGAGLGSCYIAELYHDFGVAGIAVGSMIYGVMMCAVNRIWTSSRPSLWKIGFCFGLLESFIKAPRWNFDIVFSYALDLGMWAAYGIVALAVGIGLHYAVAKACPEGLERP